MVIEEHKKLIEHIEQFREIVGVANVYIDDESLNHYAHDETEHVHCLPDIVVKPRSPKAISDIMII